MDISTELNEIIMAAYREAESRGHEYLTPEHVLYASLFFDRGREIILACGGNVETLARDLEGFFAQHVPVTEDCEAHPVRRLPVRHGERHPPHRLRGEARPWRSTTSLPRSSRRRNPLPRTSLPSRASTAWPCSPSSRTASRRTRSRRTSRTMRTAPRRAGDAAGIGDGRRAPRRSSARPPEGRPAAAGLRRGPHGEGAGGRDRPAHRQGGDPPAHHPGPLPAA